MKIDSETGMRIGVYGFFIAIIGAMIAIAALPTVGYWIGLSGAILGLIGIAIHFFKNWRGIFHVDE